MVNSLAPNMGLIDYDALARAIKVKVGKRTQEECALEAGVSSSTFSRLVRNLSLTHTQRQQTTSETVTKICRWLGVPLETYTSRGHPPKTSEPDYIEWVLLRDPKLKREDAIALSDMFRAAYNTLARKPQEKDTDEHSQHTTPVPARGRASTGRPQGTRA